tara:strand:- start:552 stop:1655 length:1104 start_codon:yes stop_codon:yes gene_type:complete
MDWYTILKIKTLPQKWDDLLSFNTKEEAERKIKQLRDDDKEHSKDRPAEGKAYRLVEKDGTFKIQIQNRPTITHFTHELGPAAAPIPAGRMTGPTTRGKWKYPDSKSPERVYEDDKRDIKIGTRAWKRRLLANPDVDIVSQKVAPFKDNPDKPSPHEGSRPNPEGVETTQIIAGKEDEFHRAMMMTIGHEWIHYLTQEEYNPMREEIAATVADMIKRGAWDENTVKEAAKDFAALNFWIEMAARLADDAQQDAFMEKTWRQYADKVAHYLVRYALQVVTGKDMKPYLRPIDKNKIDEILNESGVENKEILSKQIHEMRDIAYDEQVLEFGRLLKKYRRNLKKPQGERKTRDKKDVPKREWRLSRWEQ